MKRIIPLAAVALSLLLVLWISLAQGQTNSYRGGIPLIPSTGGPNHPTNKAYQNLDHVIDVRDYGATGTADDSATVAAAITATPSGGTLFFPAGTYIVDDEFIITTPMTICGDHATIKLKNQSSLFDDYENDYARYVFHVRSSNVRMTGLTLDLNSQNNKKVDGSTYYLISNAPTEVRMVGGIMVGWYGTGLSETDINDISVDHCSILDSPHSGISAVGDTMSIYGLRITDNYFLHCQGTQVDLSQCVGAVVSGNTHKDPYFTPFQFYYDDDSCQYVNNTVEFSTARIDLSLVDPTLQSAGALVYGGVLRLGRTHTSGHRGSLVSGNTFRGTGIHVTDGAAYCTVSDNMILASETIGIDVDMSVAILGDATSQYDITDLGGNVFRHTWDGTGTDPGLTATFPGSSARVYIASANYNAGNREYFDVIGSGTNYFDVYNISGVAENNIVSGASTTKYMMEPGIRIVGNTIIQSAQPGLYHGACYQPVLWEKNLVIGCNTSAAQYGGRDCFTGIMILNPFCDFRHNTVRRIGQKPTYGLRIHAGTSTGAQINGATSNAQVIQLRDNDITNGGWAADLYNPDGTHPGNYRVWPDMAYHVVNGTGTCDPNSLAADFNDIETVAVTGAKLGDRVDVAPPYDAQGVMMFAYVSEADVVKIKFHNTTTGTVDLGSGTYWVQCRRRETWP